MITQLDVMNIALDRLGEEPILAVDANNPRAKVISRNWEPCLRTLLRVAQWHWATTRDDLVEDTDPPAFGWSHQYLLPARFISLVMLNQRIAGVPGRWWVIEGPFLLTNETEALAQYVEYPDDPDLDAFLTRMDPLAMEAFVVLLASRVANKIVKDGTQMAQALYRQYLTVDLPRAVMKMANEGYGPPKSISPQSQWDHSRIFGTQ